MLNHKGNTIIKRMIILGDFLLLNSLLLLFFECFNHLIPPAFSHAPRTFFFASNISLLIGELINQPMIHERHINLHNIIIRVFRLTLLQAISSFVFICLLYNEGGMFKFLLIYTPCLFAGLLLARLTERLILNWYRQKGGNTRLVVLVGNDPAVMMVYHELTSDPSTGYRIEGYYADEPIKKCPANLKYFGSIQQMNQWMESETQVSHVDELFCCLSHDENEQIMRIMRFCDAHVIKFYYVPRMMGNYSLSIKPETLGSLHLYTNHVEPLQDLGNQMLKRSFDIIVSFLVCLLILPFFPIIALIIKYQSPGPLFFTQERTGLNGKTFLCYKFRSMHVNQNADKLQATQDDPRKFPFGNFMRKSNLDEFPQFFNVLKGDMSIVGPRPHMLLHTELYSNQISKYMVRHFCKPGITGWAQVTGFRGETKELWQMEERIRRDIWYIENWTFSLDLQIIFMTALSLFKHDKNAY